MSKSSSRERAAHKNLFPTVEAAQAVKPDGDKMRVFEVLKGDVSSGFTWGRHVDAAIANAARSDGYTAQVADRKTGITKEKVAAKLAEFTDEELAEMGLTRKKAKK